MGPDDALLASLGRAQRLMDAGANAPALLAMLKDADLQLKGRIGAVAQAHGVSSTFGEAQAMAYSQQIGVVTEYVKNRLAGITHDHALQACQSSVVSSGKLLNKLNVDFQGVTIPLRLREAGQLGGVVDRAFKPLLMQHATSVDRYGNAMIGEFRQIMRKGLLVGATNGQMVDALVGHGGPKGPAVSLRARVDPATGKVVRLHEEDIPEGLFVRKRYWAQRIVRTETAHAQNEGSLQAMHEQRQEFPDLGKKILAVLDNRTAPDSLYVHGQVKQLEELFTDGAGRQYLRPPGRPNDRETIVPWRLAWAETPYSAPVPPEAIAQAQLAHEPAGQARRLMVEQLTEQARSVQEAQAPALHARVETLVANKLASTMAAQRVASASISLEAATAQAVSVQLATQAHVAQTLSEAEAAVEAKVQQAATASGQLQAEKSAAVALKVAKAKADAAQYVADLKAKKAAKVLAAKEAFIAPALEDLAKIPKDEAGGKAAVNWLHHLLKVDKPRFDMIYDKVVKGWGGLSPKWDPSTGSVQGLAKKLGYPVAKKAPVAQGPVVPVVPAVYELKQSGEWVDIHHKPTGQKLAYMKLSGGKYTVAPPSGMNLPTAEFGQAQLPDAVKCALAVSDAIKAKAAKAAIEAAKAIPLPKKAAPVVASPSVPHEWKPWERPRITGSPAEEIAKRWTTARAGVGVATDAGSVENQAMTVQQEVDLDGSVWMVSRFKLTAAGSHPALSHMSKLTGADAPRAESDWEFESSDLSDRGLKKKKREHGRNARASGVDTVLRVQDEGFALRLAQGKQSASELGAMHNVVEARLRVADKLSDLPKSKASQAALAAENFTKLGARINRTIGVGVEGKPTPEATDTLMRAQLLTRFGGSGTRDALGKAKDQTGPEFKARVEALWKSRMKSLSPERQKVLKAAFTDAYLAEVAPGQVALYSPSLGEMAVKNNRHFFHDVSTKGEAVEQMFGVSTPGEDFNALLSSRSRYHQGLIVDGVSTSRDFETGGADSVFVRAANGLKVERPGYYSNRVTIDGSEFGRFDLYSYDEDKYGRALAYSSRRDGFEAIEAGARDDGSNETMLRSGVSMRSIRSVNLTAENKQALLQRLEAEGIKELNGIPVESLFK